MRLATIQTPNGPHVALQQGLTFVDLHATDTDLPTSIRGMRGLTRAFAAAPLAAEEAETLLARSNGRIREALKENG